MIRTFDLGVYRLREYRQLLDRHPNVTMRRLLILACLLAVGCAPQQSNSRRQQLVSQLREARDTDRQDALDPDVGPITQGDLMTQGNEADRVASALERGDDVSQEEIANALFVPPKTISPDLRRHLIRKLRNARTLDEQGFRGWTRDPVIEQDYRVQEERADRAMSKLVRGEPIAWWEIHEALHVPVYP